MANQKTLAKSRRRRAFRTRNKLRGDAMRPRVSVHRTSKHVYAQIIDDSTGHTLASASSMEASLKASGGTKTERAKQVGSLLGERAKAAGVDRVVFDRAGFKYHGRIRALADSARDSGLEF